MPGRLIVFCSTLRDLLVSRLQQPLIRSAYTLLKFAFALESSKASLFTRIDTPKIFAPCPLGQPFSHNCVCGNTIVVNVNVLLSGSG